MRRSTILLSVLFVLSVFLATKFREEDAKAYTLTGFRFNHLSLTYSCGNEELQKAIQDWASVSGLTDGGCSATPDVTLTIIPDAEFPPYIAGYGGAGRVFLPQRNAHHYGVMLHEVGHAIGMGHSCEYGSQRPDLPDCGKAPAVIQNSAMFPYCCSPLNEDDIAGIQALYGKDETVPPPPPVYRLRVPALARD